MLNPLKITALTAAVCASAAGTMVLQPVLADTNLKTFTVTFTAKPGSILSDDSALNEDQAWYSIETETEQTPLPGTSQSAKETNQSTWYTMNEDINKTVQVTVRRPAVTAVAKAKDASLAEAKAARKAVTSRKTTTSRKARKKATALDEHVGTAVDAGILEAGTSGVGALAGMAALIRMRKDQQ